MVWRSNKSCITVLATILMILDSIKCLHISLSPSKSSFTRADQVDVVLQYENNGPNTILIKRRFFPDGTLYDPILKVTQNGKSVEYVGRVAKWTVDTVENCIQISPNSSISTVIDVSSSYNLTKTGIYKIKFSGSPDAVQLNGFQDRDLPIEEQQNNLQKPHVLVSIEGRPNIQRTRENVSITTNGRALFGFQSCSNSRKTTISKAFTLAVQYANNAFIFLNKTNSGSRPRYTTWFGVATTTRRNTAISNFQLISTSLSSDQYIVDCSCTSGGIFAYVYPSHPYTIYVCGVFWSTTLGGTDSKAGTLIHEASHFTVVTGTDDVVYGQSACKNLAINSPDQALNNADSHEYFAENTPRLT